MLAGRSCQTQGVSERRQRLRTARLYLVTDVRPDAFLRAALRGGVDIVQLRAKDADDETILIAARAAARICREHGALFILNDRPDLVERAGADGVHVGQDDVPVAEARALVGPDRIVGLSTHSPAQVDRAGELNVDYIGVGPVHATPTKPGRPAVGHALVAHASEHARVPFFAIGGIDRGTVARGARRRCRPDRRGPRPHRGRGSRARRTRAARRASPSPSPRSSGLGQRSRKRGRRSKPAGGPVATAPSRTAAGTDAVARTDTPADAPRKHGGYGARTEERNAAVRARLAPLGPGERPWSIRIAALLALLVGGGDLVDVIAGGDIRFGNRHAGVGGVVLFAVMMLVCAVGTWRLKVWAVLGFQAILGIVILIFSLLLIRASNLLGFAVAIVIVLGGGYLFVKLVRVLSRLQMPRYPGRH